MSPSGPIFDGAHIQGGGAYIRDVNLVTCLGGVHSGGGLIYEGWGHLRFDTGFYGMISEVTGFLKVGL